MNKLIKIFGILLFTANFTQAQSSKYELGIEGGPNVSTFFGSNSKNHSSLHPEYGSSVGLAFQWNSQKSFSLRTGLTFEQNNCSYTMNFANYGSSQGGSGSGLAHYEYLKLPVLARFTYGKKVHFFFNIGAFFSLLTKQTETTEGTNYYIVGGVSQSYPYKNEFSNISNYKKIDFGLTGGLGLGLPVQKRWYFSLEVRDHFGINNIFTDNSSIRTNSLNLFLGISYKLGFREEKNN